MGELIQRNVWGRGEVVLLPWLEPPVLLTPAGQKKSPAHLSGAESMCSIKRTRGGG